ncbi:MAG: 30S ribosomal protein S5 [Candidatus Harrisonbacteria bacterium]|nr:30S ribosomal protein S5 [Candidatus Harrisonbacteria bacterium]MBI3114608.1 30S ribosomal protein S5 [Candidatus Harrisonbacteria bacterium]
MSGGARRFGGSRRRQPFPEKKADEFQEKTLDIRRVTRVVAGGKRMRFRVTLVAGDGKGRVGVGIAKGLDVAGAIEKARTAARKNIFSVPLKGRTIPHEVEAKFSAARIRLKPAVEGHGLRAGGAARTVLSLAGIRDIVAKTLGRTPNKLTNALATIAALKQLKRKPITNNS